MTECVQLNGSNIMFIKRVANQDYYVKGSVLEATVIDKTTLGTSVILDKQTITVASDININESIGDTLHLEVESITKDKIKLKYIPQTHLAESRRVISSGNKKTFEAEKDQMKIYRKVIKSLNIESEKEIDSILDQVHKSLKTLVNTMTNEDVKQLLKQDLSPDKIALEMMAKVVKNNKKIIQNQGIDIIKKEIKKEIQELKSKYQNNPQLEKIVISLKLHNLPVKNKQVEKIIETLEKIQIIKANGPDKWVNLIKLKEPVTIAEAYKASHTPVIKSNNNQLSNIEKERLITEHLKKINIPLTRKVKEVAITMLENNMDITKANIEFALNPRENINLETLDTTIDCIADLLEKEIPVETLAIKIIDTKEEIIKIENIDSKEDKKVNKVRKYTLLETKQLMRQISQIKDTQILAASMHEENVSLESMFKESISSEEVEMATDNQMKEALAHKIQLEEIRLKMTADSILQLRKQGLKIEIEPLEKVVESLKEYEKEQIKEVALIHKIKPVESVIEETLQSIDQIRQLSTLPDSLFIDILEKDNDIAIKGLVKGLEKPRLQMKVAKAYEESGTKIRSDLGDKIEKTFDQIKPMLEEMKMEVTPSAIKAVEILARNNMPIEEETIKEIQLIQEKIIRITKGMNPHLLLEMIKIGVTPLDLSIDETIVLMDQYTAKFGETEAEKISRLILELEKSGEMTEKERTSLMGIYRTFDTVVRSKGVAVGFLIKSNKTLTIDNLFEAAKFIHKTNQLRPAITANIDDDFGYLEKIIYSDISIKDQVQSGILEKKVVDKESEIKVMELLDKLKLPLAKEQEISKTLILSTLHEFIKEVSEEKMMHMLNEEPEKLMKSPLEIVIGTLKSLGRDETVRKVDLQPLLDFIRESPNVIHTLVENQIPISREVLENAITLNKEPFILMDKLRKLMALDMDRDRKKVIVNKLEKTSQAILKGEASMESLKKTILEITNDINRWQEGNMSKVNQLSDTTVKIINHTQMIQLNEEYYQIPIMMGDELSQLNMYIKNESEEKVVNESDTTTIFMKFDTKNLGEVCIYLTILDKQMVVNIQSTDSSDKELLKESEEYIKELIENTNFSLSSINYENVVIDDPIKSMPELELLKPISKLVGRKFETIV